MMLYRLIATFLNDVDLLTDSNQGILGAKWQYVIWSGA